MELEVLVEKKSQIVAFEKDATAIEQQARAMEVKDEHSRAAASDLRERARQFIKLVKAEFEPDTKKSKAAVDAAKESDNCLKARIAKIIFPAENVMGITEGKMNDYQLEVKRKEREAQALIDAETKRKNDAETERLLKLAVKQAENGKAEKAEETLQKAEDVKFTAPTLPSIDKSVKTESGSTSSRLDFDVYITDFPAMVREVAAGRLPMNCLDVKASVIKAFVKMNMVNGKFPIIPGCQFKEKFSFSGRAKAAMVDGRAANANLN